MSRQGTHGMPAKSTNGGPARPSSAQQRPSSAQQRPSSAQQRPSTSQQSASANLTPAAKRIIEKIKLVVTQRNGGNALRGLARIFRAMDNSGDMMLDREELRWGLQDYGVHLTNEEFTALWIGFDRDQSGTICFEEFLKALRGEMNASRKKWVTKAFQKLDKDGSGLVNLDDIRDVYKAAKHPKVLSGERTEEQILVEFLNGFEKYGDADGQVTLEEFMGYYQDVSNSVDDDAYFAVMMQNAWQLKD